MRSYHVIKINLVMLWPRRPTSPRFGPDGTLVVSAFRDPFQSPSDVEKILIFPKNAPPYYISLQAVFPLQVVPRQYAQNTGT